MKEGDPEKPKTGEAIIIGWNVFDIVSVGHENVTAILIRKENPRSLHSSFNTKNRYVFPLNVFLRRRFIRDVVCWSTEEGFDFKSCSSAFVKKVDEK